MIVICKFCKHDNQVSLQRMQPQCYVNLVITLCYGINLCYGANRHGKRKRDINILTVTIRYNILSFIG